MQNSLIQYWNEHTLLHIEYRINVDKMILRTRVVINSISNILFITFSLFGLVECSYLLVLVLVFVIRVILFVIYFVKFLPVVRF